MQQGGPPEAGRQGMPPGLDGAHPGRGRAGRGPAPAALAASPALRGAERLAAEPPAGRTLQAASLSYARSERTEIQIRTRDGDLVRLQIHSSDALELEAAQARDGHTAVSQLALEARSETRLSVRVEGDLDAGELRAIRDVVGQAADLAEDFYSSGADAAFERLDALEIDAGELARVQVDASLSERYTYADFGLRAAPSPAAGPAPSATTEARAAADGPTATLGQDAPRSADTATEVEALAERDAAPAAKTPPEAASAGSPEQTAAADPTASARAGAREFLEPVLERFDDDRRPTDEATEPAAAGPAASARAAAREFLERVLERFDDDRRPSGEAAGRDDATLDLPLKLQILESVLAAGAPTREGADTREAPGLLFSTLEAMAAQRRKPVSATA
jgi:hypothetical protein